MYKNAAIRAALLLIYSAIAGRIERSLLSGPIVFTAAGFILGADVLGILRIHIDGEGLPVPDWSDRLICRQCGSRGTDMVVTGTER